jgi:hypothetical protein
MRVLLVVLPCMLLAACAADPAARGPSLQPSAAAAPAANPKADAEENRRACLDRMYTARMRGAVHWHIYEYCLKEKQ